jgi:hypothetical protein
VKSFRRFVGEYCLHLQGRSKAVVPKSWKTFLRHDNSITKPRIDHSKKLKYFTALYVATHILVVVVVVAGIAGIAIVVIY